MPRAQPQFDAGKAYVPAHSIEAEQSVLGAMSLSEVAADAGMDLLDYAEFYRETHQVLFACFRDLRLSGKPVDLVTVPALLKDREQLDYIGGMAYLLALFDTVPTASNIAHYAEIVREKAALRRLASAGLEILHLSTQEDRKADELTRAAESALYALKNGGRVETGSPVQETLAAFEAGWSDDLAGSEKLRGVPTGIRAYDDFTNGLQKNKLIVIAARPGMGKSAWLSTMAMGAALGGGRASLIFSAEMERDEWMVRMVSSLSGIEAATIETGRLSDEQWERYWLARGSVQSMKFYIDEKKRPSPSYIRSVARRVASLYGEIGFIGVDYIQLMQADRETDNRVQELGRIAYDLKDMSGELKIPIVALAQLNRSVESREDKRPVLSDIRASGEIEEAADIICALYREEYYASRGQTGLDPARVQETELIFLKQRKGPTGMVKIGFVGAFTQFLDLPDALEGMAQAATRDDGPTGF